MEGAAGRAKARAKRVGRSKGGSEGYQMRISRLLDDADIVELDVQELVDGLEGAADGDVVFELDGDGVVDEGFEEAGFLGVSLRHGHGNGGMRGYEDGPEEEHLRGWDLLSGLHWLFSW